MRKPHNRWRENGRGQLCAHFGEFWLFVYRSSQQESTYKWRIESSGGDNRHAGGWSDTAENAQFAAEDWLRAFLTDALSELNCGAEGEVG